MKQPNVKAVMALLFFGVLMGALDLAIIGPALPAMQAEFDFDNRPIVENCLIVIDPQPQAEPQVMPPRTHRRLRHTQPWWIE